MDGFRLRELRLQHNLTQKELADRVKVTPKAISFYELGQREPSNELLSKFAKLFGVSVDYLLGRDDIKKEDNRISILARNASNLTEDQIKLVENIIEQFKKENDID